jgi:hypothetical protein
MTWGEPNGYVSEISGVDPALRCGVGVGAQAIAPSDCHNIDIKELDRLLQTIVMRESI